MISITVEDDWGDRGSRWMIMTQLVDGSRRYLQGMGSTVVATEDLGQASRYADPQSAAEALRASQLNYGASQLWYVEQAPA